MEREPLGPEHDERAASRPVRSASSEASAGVVKTLSGRKIVAWCASAAGICDGEPRVPRAERGDRAIENGGAHERRAAASSAIT